MSCCSLRLRSFPVARKLAPSIDPVVVGIVAVEEENVKERDVVEGFEWWWWRLQKNLHVVVVAEEAKQQRERDEREVGRMAREGERHCEKEEEEDALKQRAAKQQQQREEEEAATKESEET